MGEFIEIKGGASIWHFPNELGAKVSVVVGKITKDGRNVTETNTLYEDNSVSRHTSEDIIPRKIGINGIVMEDPKAPNLDVIVYEDVSKTQSDSSQVILFESSSNTQDEEEFYKFS